MNDKPLPKRLQPALKALEKDLLERAKLPSVEAGLRAAWEAEKEAGETGQSFDPWRRAKVTQIAVAWVLSVDLSLMTIACQDGSVCASSESNVSAKIGRAHV